MTEQATPPVPFSEHGDKVVRLKTLPVDVNVSKIAAGMLNLFTRDERVLLRFGMLPAGKIKVLAEILNEKFRTTYHLTPHGGDSFCAMLQLDPNARGYEFIDFSLQSLIDEAVAAITSELYQIGNLIV